MDKIQYCELRLRSMEYELRKIEFIFFWNNFEQIHIYDVYMNLINFEIKKSWRITQKPKKKSNQIMEGKWRTFMINMHFKIGENQV